MPQNDCLNLSFVKDTVDKKMARNGPTMATLFSVSFRIRFYTNVNHQKTWTNYIFAQIPVQVSFCQKSYLVEEFYYFRVSTIHMFNSLNFALFCKSKNSYIELFSLKNIFLFQLSHVSTATSFIQPTEEGEEPKQAWDSKTTFVRSHHMFSWILKPRIYKKNNEILFVYFSMR